MIITRTPFRVSFAGGGSDLEAFHCQEPGAVLSTAIDKYMYLTVKERFGNSFRVSYSKTELTDTVDEISHPIVRHCLRSLGVESGLEIVSVADLPGPKRDGFIQQLHRGIVARPARAWRTRGHRPEPGQASLQSGNQHS